MLALLSLTDIYLYSLMMGFYRETLLVNIFKNDSINYFFLAFYC